MIENVASIYSFERAPSAFPPFPLVFQETREFFEIRTSFPPRRGTRARLPWQGVEEKKRLTESNLKRKSYPPTE